MNKEILYRAFLDPVRSLRIISKKVRYLSWQKYADKIREPKIIANDSEYVKNNTRLLPETIGEEFQRYSIHIEDIEIAISEYNKFVNEVDYKNNFKDYNNFYSHVIHEKILEHYAALFLLNPSRIKEKNIVFMDVGSERSIVSDVYKEKYGWQVYRQDIAYKTGVHGEYIGSDAAQIPLADESVHLMASYCAYEHFESDSDIGVVKEAQRILKPGGRFVILPLYLSDKDRIVTDPVVSIPSKVNLPADIEVVCVPKYWNRFGRLYSVSTLKNRILDQWKCGPSWIVHFVNFREVHDQCYLSYGLVLEKS
jgi:SAM-dependent methyltransferase